MPHYDYYCEANGRTVELRHGITETVRTWGELRQRAGIDADDTADEAPMRRGLGGGVILTRNGSAAGSDTCESKPFGGCCGGMCQGH